MHIKTLPPTLVALTFFFLLIQVLVLQARHVDTNTLQDQSGSADHPANSTDVNAVKTRKSSNDTHKGLMLPDDTSISHALNGVSLTSNDTHTGLMLPDDTPQKLMPDNTSMSHILNDIPLTTNDTLQGLVSHDTSISHTLNDAPLSNTIDSETKHLTSNDTVRGHPLNATHPEHISNDTIQGHPLNVTHPEHISNDTYVSQTLNDTSMSHATNRITRPRTFSDTSRNEYIDDTIRIHLTDLIPTHIEDRGNNSANDIPADCTQITNPSASILRAVNLETESFFQSSDVEGNHGKQQHQLKCQLEILDHNCFIALFHWQAACYNDDFVIQRRKPEMIAGNVYVESCNDEKPSYCNISSAKTFLSTVNTTLCNLNFTCCGCMKVRQDLWEEEASAQEIQDGRDFADLTEMCDVLKCRHTVLSRPRSMRTDTKKKLTHVSIHEIAYSVIGYALGIVVAIVALMAVCALLYRVIQRTDRIAERRNRQRQSMCSVITNKTKEPPHL